MKLFPKKLRDFGYFCVTVNAALIFRKCPLQEVSKYIIQVGVGSLLTVALTGFFVGAIVTLQTYIQLKDYGANIFLGGLMTSATLRDLGPMLISFVLAAKVGAHMSSELGVMKVTDQLDALSCFGVDVVESLIAPRCLAVTLCSFILLLFGLVLTIFGGFLFSLFRLSFSWEYFATHMATFITAKSVSLSVLKSLIFGMIISYVSCFEGYRAYGGSLGVGRVVRKTAVEVLVLVIWSDFLITFLWG